MKRAATNSMLPWTLVALSLLFSWPARSEARAQGPGASSRERSALADDQALLQRQLARLRQTMEVLASRFEAEGRTHAAKLLREGLSHLADRAADQGSKTVDELMGGARSSLESGQSVQALEVQEAVVRGLEKLYAILTDRQGIDDLERSLEELRKIKADLGALADQEKDLRQKTAALDDKAAGPGRKDLQQGIEKAIVAQRDLLARTETQARQSGEMELEAIERALEALATRQSTDAAVLESWKPAEQPALEVAAPSLSQASERAAAAQRLAQAARELRAAAAAARDEKADLAAAQRDLETAADREERRDRSAGESADPRAAKALRAAAQAFAQVPATPAGRADAGRAAADQAAALEQAAEAELAAARERREAALAALGKLGDPKTAAGEVAARARAALRAPAGGPEQEQGLEDRAEAARRAAEEAGRALSAGLDEQATLSKALSSSQAAASEESARLERALGALQEGKTSPGEEARSALSAAAEAQQGAAQSASKGEAEDAAASARAAERRLSAAREALARARAQRAEAPQSPEQSEPARALAREQAELAQSMDALSRQAAQEAEEGTPPESRAGSTGEAAKAALAAAQSSMESASRSLSKGSASSASSAQREAISRLQEAAENARRSKPLSRPEDREQAQTQAKEQEQIRQELLDLARRNQKRDTAKPSPSLAQAGESAARARQSLEEADLTPAQGSEEDAERKMRESLRELSEEEEQYQKLRAEELLFKVAEQVKALQEGHREQMRATIEIDGTRKEAEPATHTQRLRLRKVAKAEEALGARTGEIGKAIRAEESLVFAEVLDETARDLGRLSRDLGEDGGYQSGERVQALQQDVEQGLAWLYEALQAEKERRRQEQQQGSGSGSKDQRGQNRLVPDAAELKLLRRLEVENLESLARFKILHSEIAAGQPVDPLVLEDLGRLAGRHQRTSDLFEKFRKRLGLPDPPVQEP